MGVIFNAGIHHYPKMHVVIDGLFAFTMLEPQHLVSLSVYQINVTDVSSNYLSSACTICKEILCIKYDIYIICSKLFVTEVTPELLLSHSGADEFPYQLASTEDIR
jgi:hypothetical protein